MNTSFRNSVTIEMKLPVGMNQVPFPDNPYLRGKKITGIVVNIAIVTPANNANYFYSGLQLEKCFINLTDSNTFKFVENLPLVSLAPIASFNKTAANVTGISTNDVNGVFELFGREIVWTKTYLFFPDGVANLYTNQSVVLTVFYEETRSIKPPLPRKKNQAVCFQLVTIEVNSVSGKYFFPDQPNLHGVLVQRTNWYYNVSVAKNPNKVAVVGSAVGQGGFLTLAKGKDEFIKQLDVSLMHTVQTTDIYYNNSGSLYLDNVEIDFDKSYLEFPSTTNPVVAPISFVLGVFYIKK